MAQLGQQRSTLAFSTTFPISTWKLTGDGREERSTHIVM